MAGLAQEEVTGEADDPAVGLAEAPGPDDGGHLERVPLVPVAVQVPLHHLLRQVELQMLNADGGGGALRARGHAEAREEVGHPAGGAAVQGGIVAARALSCELQDGLLDLGHVRGLGGTLPSVAWPRRRKATEGEKDGKNEDDDRDLHEGEALLPGPPGPRALAHRSARRGAQEAWPPS